MERAYLKTRSELSEYMVSKFVLNAGKKEMKQVGKIGKINAKANKKIAQMWIDKDIYYCEACAVLYDLDLLKWQCIQASSNAHRNGRVWYRGKPEELLWSFEQVIRACIPAHDFLDNNPEVKKTVFLRLRGKEVYQPIDS